MTHIVFAPFMLSALAFIATTAATRTDAADPQMTFNNACRTCHSMKERDNRLGPSLAGVVGRRAGSLPGFRYSSSMQSSGITWDEQTLDKFIAKDQLDACMAFLARLGAWAERGAPIR